jgi:hypothetical protein
MPIRLAASQTEGYYTGVQCGCGRCVSWRRVTGVGGRGTRTPHEYPPTRSPGDFDGGGAPLEQHSEPRRPPAPWSGRRFAHGSTGPGLPPPPASHLTGAPQSTDWAPPAADTTPSRGSENCALIDWRNTPPAVVGGGHRKRLCSCAPRHGAACGLPPARVHYRHRSALPLSMGRLGSTWR